MIEYRGVKIYRKPPCKERLRENDTRMAAELRFPDGKIVWIDTQESIGQMEREAVRLIDHWLDGQALADEWLRRPV